MISNYFDQFNVVRLVTSQPLGEGWLLTITNATLMVVLTVLLTLLLFRGTVLIPNRWQLIGELVHGNIRSIVHESLGKAGEKFFPFILCLFLFIAGLNILGLFPYVFTPTAHIVVTFGLSLSIMIGVTILGFIIFKIEFFSILVPGGVPLILAPFLVIIETLSYMIRVISLGLRLAANISAGHLLFAILSSFVLNLFKIGFWYIGVFPLLITGFITLLEMIVALIQAYVFCLLTTIYLGDATER